MRVETFSRGRSELPSRIGFVALRPPRAATGETATIAYHHQLLERQLGIEVVHLAGDAADGFSLSLLGGCRLGHLTGVRPRLREQPDLPAVWFVPSPGQLPIVSWAMRGLLNPTAVIIEGAPLLREGDWWRAVRLMPGFLLPRAILNGEHVARLNGLVHHRRPIAVATASRYHLERLRRVVPGAHAVWLPNGSPGLPLRNLWDPPSAPNPRLLGHALRNKGADLALRALARLQQGHPDLTVDWARPERGPVPAGLIPPGLTVRCHELVDPYAFLAKASVVLVPLRLSCGTNVFPNVVIEAMSAGVPLLTSDLPAHRDLLGPVADEAIVPGFAPETWASRVETLLADPARASMLGHRLLERACELWGAGAPAQRWLTLLDAMGAPAVAVR